MIVLRKLQGYRDKLIKEEIKSKESVISYLKKDLLKVHGTKGEYKNKKSYESDVRHLEKEIEKYQKKVDSLKKKIEP